MLIPDLIIQLIAVVIGVALYATIFKILKIQSLYRRIVFLMVLSTIAHV